MTIQTNTANRKVLAEHISRLIGEPCRYLRVPSCAYQVGPYTINRDGSISGQDLEPLRGFLRENGYIPNEEKPAEETPQLPENRSADASSSQEAGLIPNMDISIPTRDITPAQLKNLVFMLYSRQTLLNRMTGRDCLSIPDSLIERLQESTPDTAEAFTGLLEVSRCEAGLSGFDYRDGSDPYGRHNERVCTD